MIKWLYCWVEWIENDSAANLSALPLSAYIPLLFNKQAVETDSFKCRIVPPWMISVKRTD